MLTQSPNRIGINWPLSVSFVLAMVLVKTIYLYHIDTGI